MRKTRASDCELSCRKILEAFCGQNILVLTRTKSCIAVSYHMFMYKMAFFPERETFLLWPRVFFYRALDYGARRGLARTSRCKRGSRSGFVARALASKSRNVGSKYRIALREARADQGHGNPQKLISMVLRSAAVYQCLAIYKFHYGQALKSYLLQRSHGAPAVTLRAFPRLPRYEPCLSCVSVHVI